MEKETLNSTQQFHIRKWKDSCKLKPNIWCEALHLPMPCVSFFVFVFSIKTKAKNWNWSRQKVIIRTTSLGKTYWFLLKQNVWDHEQNEHGVLKN